MCQDIHSLGPQSPLQWPHLTEIALAIRVDAVYIRYHSGRGVGRFRQHNLRFPGLQSVNNASCDRNDTPFNNIYKELRLLYPMKSAT